MRNPDTGKFVPSPSAVAAVQTKAAEVSKWKAVEASKEKDTPAKKKKAASDLKKVVTPALKEKVGSSLKKKAVPDLKKAAPALASKDYAASSNDWVQLCRNCFEGGHMCENWLYGKGPACIP